MQKEMGKMDETKYLKRQVYMRYWEGRSTEYYTPCRPY